MVEKASEQPVSRKRRGHDPVIWLTRELEYRAGLDIEAIAARHEVKPVTVRTWAKMRKWSRPIDPKTLASKRLAVEIAGAEAAIADGDLNDAERRIRVASALGRAAQTLARLGEGADTETNRKKGMTRNNAGDTPDFKAELERRLLRIIRAVESASDVEGTAQELKSESGESTSR